MNVNAVKTGLYSKLTGDATLTALLASSTAVYDKQAPQGSATPYVIFQKLSGVPTYAFAGRAYDTNTFMVKAVDDSPSGAIAGQIAERIDALLTDGTLTLSTGSLMVLRRATDLDYTEAADGRNYQHIGATYTVGVQ